MSIEVIDQAVDAANGPERAREQADVGKWQERITQARKYDEEARKQYAKDRRYARGDSGFEVDANIVGTNIDILESFLYANDPDVDVLPARSCQPPSVDAVRAAVEEAAAQSPELDQAAAYAYEQAVLSGADEGMATQLGQEARDLALAQMVEAQFKAAQDRYQARVRDAKAYGETIEIVISTLWGNADLKGRGRRAVRSGLTTGLGVLKASWQERTAPSPETVQAINDLQTNIRLAAQTRAEMDEASGTDLDVKMEEYRRQLESLHGQAEQVVQRGFVIDQVQSEDFQVAPGYQIANHLDAPWNAHRIPMLKCDAKVEFNLSSEDIKGATCYSARKPENVRQESANITDITAEQADGFVTSSNGTTESGEWVMIWEIWDRSTSHVLTYIEGLKRWVKKPWQPSATTRFYPFFLYTTSEVDGQRHPQSLVTRASKLVDEYNRIGSAEAEHRRRIKPKMLFLKGQVGSDAMTKVMEGTTAEYVGVETTQPNVPLGNIFMPLSYPMLDPALYDRSRIVNEIERIFGVQEALAGSVNTAKTATEAQIQQGGFNARTGGRRDQLEMMLQDLAKYTAEVARAHMDAEDVAAIAGPDAMWPPYEGALDLDQLVTIEIRAGSSGKPNTAAEREAWAAQLPIMQNAIMQIAQLRNSTPSDIADSLETLLQITADRSGDRDIDIAQIVPKPGPAPVGPPIDQPAV